MKISEVNNTAERLILINLITNLEYLQSISNKITKNCFASKYSDIIATWCVKHYTKYGKTPKKAIIYYFKNWSEKQKDPATVESVENLLTSLSEDSTFEKMPLQYLLDETVQHLTKIKIADTIAKAESLVEVGRINEASDILSKYASVELATESEADILDFDHVIDAAFSTDLQEDLLTWKGALGKFFKYQCRRGCFMAFQAPDKSGKSFWLQEMAYQGMLQKKKVMYVSVGDMNREQIANRLMVRNSRHPLMSKTGWPVEVRIPKKIIYGSLPKSVPIVEYTVKRFEKPLDREQAKKDLKKTLQGCELEDSQSPLHLNCYESNTFNTNQLKALIEKKANKNWIPDIIVIDYADVLACPDGCRHFDPRDQIHETWMNLRSVSQKNVFLVTASQSDSDAYGKETLDRRNFSGDKRKNAEVTAMIGINIKEEERKKQLTRLNYIVCREGEYVTSDCVYVANCLALANPAVISI